MCFSIKIQAANVIGSNQGLVGNQCLGRFHLFKSFSFSVSQFSRPAISLSLSETESLPQSLMSPMKWGHLWSWYQSTIPLRAVSVDL